MSYLTAPPMRVSADPPIAGQSARKHRCTLFGPGRGRYGRPLVLTAYRGDRSVYRLLQGDPSRVEGTVRGTVSKGQKQTEPGPRNPDRFHWEIGY